MNVHVPMDWGIPPRALTLATVVPQVALAGTTTVALHRLSGAVARPEDVAAA